MCSFVSAIVMVGVLGYFLYKAYRVIKGGKGSVMWRIFQNPNLDRRVDNAKFFPFFELVKRILGSVGLVVAYYMPVYQVGIITLLDFVYWLSLVICKPFTEKKIYVFVLTIEGTSVLIHFLISSFLGNYSSDLRETIGIFILALISLSLSIAIFPVIG